MKVVMKRMEVDTDLEMDVEVKVIELGSGMTVSPGSCTTTRAIPWLLALCKYLLIYTTLVLVKVLEILPLIRVQSPSEDHLPWIFHHLLLCLPLHTPILP